MDDLPPRDLGRPAPSGGLKLLRSEAYQSPRKHPSVRSGDVHGIAGREVAEHPGNAHREQTSFALDNSSARPAIDGHGPIGRLTEGDPQFAGREPNVARMKVRAELLSRGDALDHIGFGCSGNNHSDSRETRNPRGSDLRGHPAGREGRSAASCGALQLGRELLDLFDQWGVGVCAWIGSVHTIGVGQQQENFRNGEVRDESCQSVVFSEANLVDGNGVVLIHNWDGTESNETVECVASIKVLLALHEVVASQEQLRGDHSLIGKEARIARQQFPLPHSGHGLKRGYVARPPRELEWPQAGGYCSRGHKNNVESPLPNCSDPLAQRRQPLVVEASVGTDQRRCPDLPDQPVAGGEHWTGHQVGDVSGSKSNAASPILTSSPARAPASERRRSTPMVTSRRCSLATASSLSRSVVSTARSARRPRTRHAPFSRSTRIGSSRTMCRTYPTGAGIAARARFTRSSNLSTSSGMLCPVTADMGRAPGSRSRSSSTRSPAASNLLATTMDGRTASSGSKAASSAKSNSWSRNGSRSVAARSPIKTSTAARLTCRKNRCPRPLPACAPSTRPGISATTNDSSPLVTTPRFGVSVVNGYSAIFGRALLIREISVDFPAFGNPTSPTSARSLSSRCSFRSSPVSPFWAKAGARLVGVANLALPFPPRPPDAATSSSPGLARSAISVPSSSWTTVPAGTRMIRSRPLAP